MSKYTQDQITENRRAWIAALRSGKYRQICGKGSDGEGNGCAMHVAGRLAGCEPDRVGYSQGKDFLGIDSIFGTVSGGDIVIWNDTHKLSFSEIADKAEALWFPSTQGAKP